MKKKDQLSPREKLVQGLEQLAFGDITDAIRLQQGYAEHPRNLPQANITAVAAISRPKGI